MWTLKEVTTSISEIIINDCDMKTRQNL
jgi:hypothetical protein